MAMRVLFTTSAGLGHIHPTVPLAQAMAARGHEVVWAVPPDGVDHVEKAGIRAVAVGTAGLTQPAEVRRRWPEIGALPPAEQPDVMFGKLFGAISAPDRLPGLVSFAQEWRPQLVVADAADFAGHIVAAEQGVPCASKAFGPLLPERRYVSAAEEVAPLWRSLGLEPRPYGGAFDHLYLDIYPPELPGPPGAHVTHRQLLRPVAYDGQGKSGESLPLPEGRDRLPLVYVTMGTVFNDPAPLQSAVDALGGLDVRVLVTVGPRADPAVLSVPGPHVRVERYVAQTRLLPECDAVVSHGGSGTVLATLGHGLPQLCLPQGADQFLNAEAVASVGAGISLMPGQATAEAVADAVTRLLDDGTFGEAAARIGASIALMPSPDEVAEVLEHLA